DVPLRSSWGRENGEKTGECVCSLDSEVEEVWKKASSVLESPFVLPAVTGMQRLLALPVDKEPLILSAAAGSQTPSVARGELAAHPLCHCRTSRIRFYATLLYSTSVAAALSLMKLKCRGGLIMDHPLQGGEVASMVVESSDSGEEAASSGKLNIAESQKTVGLFSPDACSSMRRWRTSSGYSKHGRMQWVEPIRRPS
ncbi:hypothetical protein ACLOJK_038235, partial [Asimina triloba]